MCWVVSICLRPSHEKPSFWSHNLFLTSCLGLGDSKIVSGSPHGKVTLIFVYIYNRRLCLPPYVHVLAYSCEPWRRSYLQLLKTIVSLICHVWLASWQGYAHLRIYIIITAVCVFLHVHVLINIPLMWAVEKIVSTELYLLPVGDSPRRYGCSSEKCGNTIQYFTELK